LSWERRIFAATVLAAMASQAGTLPEVVEVALAGRATDFTRGFVAARWVAEGRPLGALDGPAGNAQAAQVGADPVDVPCGPFYLNPPPALLLPRALLPLGYRWAARAWLALSVAAAWALGSILLALGRRSDRLPPPHLAAVATLAILLWPPTTRNVIVGQWSLLLAALLALGWWCRERGAEHALGGVVGAATVIKLGPAALLGYLALRRARLLVSAAAVALGLCALAWPLTGGWEAWRAFFRDGPPDVLCWQTFVDNTGSLRGLLARALVGDALVRPLVHAPGLARALHLAAALLLVGGAALVTWRRRRLPPDADDGPVLALWATLIPLVGPLSWSHYPLFLLLPAVLVARPPSSAGVRRAVAVAVVALSIPRGALFVAAAPLPYAPSRSWLLGLHALGGLLLYAAAARAAAYPSTQSAILR